MVDSCPCELIGERVGINRFMIPRLGCSGDGISPKCGGMGALLYQVSQRQSA